LALVGFSNGDANPEQTCSQFVSPLIPKGFIHGDFFCPETAPAKLAAF
jgi:hypothetical protein